MKFQLNKTKIVCTIGPVSESSKILENMILAGMNVARINFSHGDFTGHEFDRCLSFRILGDIQSTNLP
jgi:pyruvate kinase